MISRAPYATVADYSPRGTSELSKKSRNACYAIKNGNPSTIAALIGIITAPIHIEFFKGIFTGDTTLVPAPKSGLLIPNGLWPAHVLCTAIKNAGFCKDIHPLLVRSRAVPKSSTCAPGDRPTWKVHYDSFTVERSLITPRRIVLVDDVISRGRTAFAGLARLSEEYPEAEVLAFGAIRTKGFVDIEKFVNPTLGNLILGNDDDIHRDD